MELKVPNISVIIGEGGSGGAIALASSNKVIMLENAIYSVISPEGCASILWRDPKKTLEAAEAMKLTSKDLLRLKIIDEIIDEPLGGAHRDRQEILIKISETLEKNLNEFSSMDGEEIFNHRKNKFLSIGRKKGYKFDHNTENDLTEIKKNRYDLQSLFSNRKILVPGIIIVLLFLLMFLN